MAELYVNSAYNSTTEGWGTTHFSSYESAQAYVVTNYKGQYSQIYATTIIVEDTDTVSGNCLTLVSEGNKNSEIAGMAVTVQDGSVVGHAASILHVTYALTLEAGAVWQSARGVNSGYGNTHVKSNLVIGEAGSEKQAQIKFISGADVPYKTMSIALLEGNNRSIIANNALIEVGDLGLQYNASFTDTTLTIDGILAIKDDPGVMRSWSGVTMTDSTVTIKGHNIMNENTYYSTEGTILSFLTLDNTSVTVDDKVDSTAAETVWLGYTGNAKHTLTMTNGSVIKVEKDALVKVANTVTVTDSRIEAGTFDASATVAADSGWYFSGLERQKGVTYDAVIYDLEGNEVERITMQTSGTNGRIYPKFTPLAAGKYTAKCFDAAGNLVTEKNYSFNALGTVTLTNSDLVADTVKIANGNVTMDIASTISFNKIEGGYITVTGADVFTGGAYKLFDYTGSGAMSADDYKVILNNQWNDNYTVINNDLYLAQLDTTTVYVNTAWAGKEIGDVVDGKIFGVNAFANLNDAISATAAGNTIIVESGAVTSTHTANPDTLKRSIVIKDGAEWSFSNNEGLKMSYDVTVEAGGKITGNFLKAEKGTLFLQGTAEKAAVYGKATSYPGGNLEVRSTGKLDADYANIYALLFRVKAGSATVDNSYIYAHENVELEKATLTNVTMDVRTQKASTFGGSWSATTIAGTSTVTVGGMIMQSNGTLKADNSSKTAATVTNLTLKDSATMLFKDASSDTVTKMTIQDSAKAVFNAGATISTLTVKDNAQVDFNAASSIVAGKTVTIQGNAVVSFTTLANEGTIKIDGSSLLKADSITGAGTFVIDASKYTGGFKQVIDLDGTTSLEGKVTISNGNGIKAVFGADGDVYLTNQTTDTLYVNSAWAGKAFGDDADGKAYGYNAFGSLAEIAGIKIADGADTTIKFESDVTEKSSQIFNYGTGDIYFAADKAVTLNTSDLVFWIGQEEGNQSDIYIGENVTVNIADNNTDFAVYYGANLHVSGTIKGGQNWGSLYVANGTEHTIESTGTVAMGRVQTNYTTLTVNGDAASDRTAAHIDTNYLLIEGSTFNANNAIIDAGAIHDTNNGGMRYGASEFNFNNSKLTAGSLTIKYADSVVNFTGSDAEISGAVTNAGTIKVIDSTITANYYGTGTMYLDDAVVNGTLNVAWRDEALNGSKVVAHTGSLVVTGDVTLNGVINNSVQVDQGGGEPDGISNNPGDAGEFYSPYHNKGISGKILMGSADKVANVTLNGSIITGGNTSLLAGSMLVTSGSGIYGMTENEGAWMNINTNGHFDFAVGDMNVYGTADNFDVAFDGENPIAEVTLADGAEMSRLGYIWIGSDQHDKGTGAYVLNISAGAEVTSFYNLTLRGDGVVNVAGKIESFTAKAYQSGPQEHASDGGYVNNNGVMNVSSTGFVKVNGMNVGRKPALGVAELNIDGGTFEFGRYGMNVGYSSRDGKIVMTNGATLKSVDHNITLQYNDGASAGINNNLETAAGKLMIGTAGVGSIKVSDSTVDVSSVVVDAANGAFEVTGKSKLVIDSLTGVIDADDAELTGSVTGGTLNVTGNSKVTMASAGNKIVFGSAEKSVDADVDVTGWTKADFTVQNGTVDITGVMDDGGSGLAPMLIGGFYNNNGTDIRGEAAMGSTVVNVAADALVKAHQVYISENEAVNEHTLNVYGELVASQSIYNKAMGNLNVYGQVSTNYLQAAGDVTVSGADAVLTLAGVGGNGAAKVGTDEEGLRSQFVIANGATVDADGAFAIGYNNGSRQGDLVLSSGKLDVASLSIDAGSSLLLNAVNGVVLVGGELSGTGSITIDAADFTGSKLLVDVSSSTFTGEITLTNAAENVSIIYGADGDIVLSDVTLDTIYVNAAWEGYAYGDIFDGKIFGVNAFASLDTISVDASQGVRTIKYTADKSGALEIGITSVSGRTDYQIGGYSRYVRAGNTKTETLKVETGNEYTFVFTNEQADFELSYKATAANAAKDFDVAETATGITIEANGSVSEAIGKQELSFTLDSVGDLNFTISISNEGKVEYTLLDAAGKTVLHGYSSKAIRRWADNLAKGEYTLVVESMDGKTANFNVSGEVDYKVTGPSGSDMVSGADDTIASAFEMASGTTAISNWVGNTDGIDYIDITDALKEGRNYLSIQVAGSAQATIWTRTNGELVELISWNISDEIDTRALRCTAGVEYFVSMKSDNDSNYTMQLS